MANKKRKLTTRQYATAVAGIAKLAYKAALLTESRIFKQLFADKTRTVITISHRLTTVEKADRIYMLQNGIIIEQGTHKESVALRGAYYTMFESQIN